MRTILTAHRLGIRLARALRNHGCDLSEPVATIQFDSCYLQR